MSSFSNPGAVCRSLVRYFSGIRLRGESNRSLANRSPLGFETLEDRIALSALGYSTLVGGGMTDSAFAVAADAAGNTYVTGMTVSANFPVTPGAFDGSLNGLYDAFVAKFRPNGSLAWATYLGGDGDERAHGIAVDGSGNVYVTGRTNSANFPTTAGSLDTTFNGGVDAFITKLNADGATLAYSTFLGGAGFEMDQEADMLARRVGGIAVDAAGNAFVTGSTTSSNFPTTAGAFRTTNGGFIDAFVSKLNATGSALHYSTFLGGSDADRGYGIAVDSSGNAYIMGEAVSVDFPTTAGAFQTAKGGGFNDTFVTKLNATGSMLVYSSYLGGTLSENPGRLVVDGTGQAYVTGATSSFNFPTTAGAFQTARAANGYDAFVTKVNAAGSAMIYSTYLGGGFGNDYGEAIAVDASGRAHITGYTVSATFPVANAFQATRNGVNDAFVASLNESGSALVQASYLGGSALSGTESTYGIAVDAAGTVHVVGKTDNAYSQSQFPTTADAFQPNFAGGASDAFVARISTHERMDFYGTPNNDVFTFNAGPVHFVTINGEQFELPAWVSMIQIHGNKGYDEINVTGTTGDEDASLWPGILDLRGPGYRFGAADIEKVRVIAVGGNDKAVMYDSPGNDKFEGRPTFGVLSGAGFENRVDGFDRVSAFANSGGVDTANLYDSKGNDVFVSRPTVAYLSGGNFYNEATGFDRVAGFGRAGGTDSAYLYDSAGNDRFVGRPAVGTFSGVGFNTSVNAFDRVYVYATAGGNDQAFLYDSPGNDLYYGRGNSGQLSGSGFLNYVEGFDTISAHGTSGGINKLDIAALDYVLSLFGIWDYDDK